MSKLTARKVQAATAGRYADGKGLYLLVKPSGTRTWVLRIVLHGRRRDFGLGSVSFEPPSPEVEQIPIGRRRHLSLQEARLKADEGKRLVKSGKDPSQEWKKLAQRVPTFEEAARQCHELKATGWKGGAESKHSLQWITTLERHVFPLFGKTPVDEIDHNAMWSALAPIWQDRPETARRVKQRIGKVVNFAAARGWRATEAPMGALKELSPTQLKQKGHFAALPYQRIPAVMVRLREAEQTVGRLALQFNLLTFVRPINVRRARWSEVDWDAAEWRIPVGSMKAPRTHIVPLTPASLDVLRAMLPFSGGGDLIFPGTKKGKSLSDATVAKAFRLAGGEGATVHGTARSGFRDWFSETTRWPGEWAEAALAHVVKDQTEAAYRRTTFLQHRAEHVMPAWSTFIMSEANKVVSLASVRA